MDTAPKIVDFNEKRYDYKRQVNYGEVFRMKEGKNMDDLLKSYIEKVDRDQSALREDIRESERRTEKRIEDSEQRMDKRLDKIEQLISSQNNKIDELKQSVNDKLEDDKKYRHTNNIAIVIGVITTVIAMVGIYYATISTITGIISAVK